MWRIKNVCFQKRSKRWRGFPPAGINMKHSQNNQQSMNTESNEVNKSIESLSHNIMFKLSQHRPTDAKGVHRGEKKGSHQIKFGLLAALK